MTSASHFAMLGFLRGVFLKLLSAVNLSSRPKITLSSEPACLRSRDPKTGKATITSLDAVLKRCQSLTDYYTPTPWLSRSVPASLSRLGRR